MFLAAILLQICNFQSTNRSYGIVSYHILFAKSPGDAPAAEAVEGSTAVGSWLPHQVVFARGEVLRVSDVNSGSCIPHLGMLGLKRGE